jgi:hypothetical protein
LNFDFQKQPQKLPSKLFNLKNLPNPEKGLALLPLELFKFPLHLFKINCLNLLAKTPT